MATATINHEASGTVAELLEQLGDLSPERVLLKPFPGTATIDDLIAMLERPRKRICELVDGTLVEKAVGAEEALLGSILLQLMRNYLDVKPYGMAIGADGMWTLAPRTARAPDVSFISKSRLTNGRLPRVPIPSVVPDLAVEVLSISNTKKEMKRKVKEYFKAGTREVWLIHPIKEMAEIYSSPSRKRTVGKSGILKGGRIIPGFRLSMEDLFARFNKEYF